jgi:hypothetical protein
LIKREKIEGGHQAFTLTDKRSGDFICLALRKKKLKKFQDLRFFSERVSPENADPTNPHYMGKLEEKFKSDGTEMTLYRCSSQDASIDDKKQRKDGLEKEEHVSMSIELRSKIKVPKPRVIKLKLTGPNAHTRMLRNYCAEKRSMKTKLAVFDSPVTSHKNFVLMWEENPVNGEVSGDVDDNIVELAKVGADDFQLNVKDSLSPFQAYGVALGSIVA